MKKDYGYDKSDEDIIDQVLKVLPTEYEMISHLIKYDRDNGRNYDVDDVCQKLRTRYEEIKLIKKK